MVAANDICNRDNTVSDSGWSAATRLLNSPFSDTRFMLSYAWRKKILSRGSQAHVGVAAPVPHWRPLARLDPGRYPGRQGLIACTTTSAPRRWNELLNVNFVENAVICVARCHGRCSCFSMRHAVVRSVIECSASVPDPRLNPVRPPVSHILVADPWSVSYLGSRHVRIRMQSRILHSVLPSLLHDHRQEFSVTPTHRLPGVTPQLL